MSDEQVVWAVIYGNYEPPELIGLYDNKQAAETHAATNEAYKVASFEVWRKPFAGGTDYEETP